MALEFRDHQILVISPGSRMTQAQMGLSESLLPPAFEFPTRVYRDPNTQKLSMTANAAYEAVEPIFQGRIVDEAAFLYMLKMIYRSVRSLDGLPPAVYLVASLGWTRRQLERVSRYLFEEVGVPALAVDLQGVAAACAFALNDCLVIDVGLDKTEITSVVGLEAKRQASFVVNTGGSSINAALQAKLPQLSAEQIEDLKVSSIYEVLGVDQTAFTPRVSGPNEEEDGVVDVAAIVVSGRAREILNKREQQKHDETREEANTDLEHNSFTDRNGQQVSVGYERFGGTEKLTSAIVDRVADVLYNLEPRQQQALFESIIITGRGSTVNGLKQVIADKLESRYVIRPRAATGPVGGGGLNPNAPTLPTEETDAPTQSPTGLAAARLPDHFPEWKSRRWDDYVFLGAQIGAKQVLTTGIEGFFVSRQDYNEVGPSSIWESFN